MQAWPLTRPLHGATGKGGRWSGLRWHLLTFAAVLAPEARLGAVADGLVIEHRADAPVEADVLPGAQAALLIIQPHLLALHRRRLRVVDPDVRYPALEGLPVLDGGERQL